MDQAIKKKWTDALRSGEYHQGRMSLKREAFEDELEAAPEVQFRHCCLGVLCEVVPEVTFKPKIDWNDQQDRSYYRAFTSEFGQASTINLTHEIRKIVGIDIGQENKLVELNDDDNATFAEIADWIDANL